MTQPSDSKPTTDQPKSPEAETSPDAELGNDQLDKVVGGLTSAEPPIFAELVPIFAKMVPIFAKVMSYRDKLQRDRPRAKVSLSQLYEKLAAEPLESE